MAQILDKFASSKIDSTHLWATPEKTFCGMSLTAYLQQGNAYPKVLFSFNLYKEHRLSLRHINCWECRKNFIKNFVHQKSLEPEQ